MWNKGVPILVAAFGALLSFVGVVALKRRAAPVPSFDPQV
jgi:hypothetical protein